MKSAIAENEIMDVDSRNKRCSVCIAELELDFSACTACDARLCRFCLQRMRILRKCPICETLIGTNR